MTFRPTGQGLDVFKDRYARTPDETWEQACDRVAYAMALAEGEKVSKFREDFGWMLTEGLFMPGGRIWYGAGRSAQQMLNCFVIPTDDSMSGWGKTISDLMQITALGGGVGMNLSPIRGRAYPISRGGESTGAVSLGMACNSVGDVLRGGGGRRIAMMQCLDFDHPDIEEFISAKLDRKHLNNANVSVVIPQHASTEKFVQAVENGSSLPLQYNGRADHYGRKLDMGELWDTIVKNAWQSGEPGVLNAYLANKESNIAYKHPLVSTNPCVTGDTRILTRDGYEPIARLVDHYVEVWNGREWSEVVPRVTGHDRELVKITLTDGTSLTCTENHRWVLKGGEVVPAVLLATGDKLERFDMPVVEYGEPFENAYTHGFYCGDGTKGLYGFRLHGKKAELEPALAGVGITENDLGLWFQMDKSVPLDKSYVPLDADVESRLAWFAGLLDADGTVVRNPNSACLQLSSSEPVFLKDVRLMLTTLGVQAKVTKSREAGSRLMPDGRGGEKEYQHRAQYRLLISAYDTYRLMQLGLPCKRLEIPDTEPQRDARRYVMVASVEAAGVADTVYCFTEPLNHTGTFEGIVTGQCGEIWLPAYGCCDLGALVLPRFAADGYMNWQRLGTVIHLAVRFLDNVLTVNEYPLPEIERMCQSERRLGLGVMGLHSLLLDLGMTYDSEEAYGFVDALFEFIKEQAYEASIELACEKGTFADYSPALLRSPYIKRLDIDIRKKISKHGLRNCALLTIAPTGTTSMVHGVSGGIEPLFAPVYVRRRWKGNDLHEELIISEDYLDHPATAQGSHDVSVEDHFRMQATVQPHIDNAVSKTINLPTDYPVGDLSKVWLGRLHELKGTTFYRSGSREREPMMAVPTSETQTWIDRFWEEGKPVQVAGNYAQECPNGVCEL